MQKKQIKIGLPFKSIKTRKFQIQNQISLTIMEDREDINNVLLVVDVDMDGYDQEMKDEIQNDFDDIATSDTLSEALKKVIKYGYYYTDFN